MDGMETTGVDVSIAPLVGSYRNIMSFFTRIRSAKLSTYKLEDQQESPMVFIGILHLRFARWGAAVKLSEGIASLKELNVAVKRRDSVPEAKDKLALMANELERISKITIGRTNEEGDASATANKSMTSRALIQKIRQIADSRQCKDKTLDKARWHLMLQKIRHGSFRRQCRLSAAERNWIFRDEDVFTLDGLISMLSNLIGELEELIPGDQLIRTSCCEEEVTMLRPMGQPDSMQRSQLIVSMGKFDRRLERAMGWRKDGNRPRALQVNENGFF